MEQRFLEMAQIFMHDNDPTYGKKVALTKNKSTFQASSKLKNSDELSECIRTMWYSNRCGAVIRNKPFNER